jgi:hypothetical protein
MPRSVSPTAWPCCPRALSAKARILRIEPDGSVEVLDSPSMPPRVALCCSAVIEGLGVLRLDGYGPGEVLNGLLVVPQLTAG